MSLDVLVALTCQGDIREILFFSQIWVGGGDVGMEVVPLQAKFLREGHCYFYLLRLPQDPLCYVTCPSLGREGGRDDLLSGEDKGVKSSD